MLPWHLRFDLVTQFNPSSFIRLNVYLLGNDPKTQCTCLVISQLATSSHGSSLDGESLVDTNIFLEVLRVLNLLKM